MRHTHLNNPDAFLCDIYVVGFESYIFFSTIILYFQFKKCSNWSKGIKICSEYIFIHERNILQNDSILIEYSPTDRKKNLQIKYSTEKYTISMYKMVRKCGQNQDFTKFHSAPQN